MGPLCLDKNGRAKCAGIIPAHRALPPLFSRHVYVHRSFVLVRALVVSPADDSPAAGHLCHSIRSRRQCQWPPWKPSGRSLAAPGEDLPDCGPLHVHPAHLRRQSRTILPSRTCLGLPGESPGSARRGPLLPEGAKAAGALWRRVAPGAGDGALSLRKPEKTSIIL